MAEVTNYIDRLVAELCPDGVEYRPLGEICAIRAGGDLPESYVKGQKEASDLHPYPIYSNGSEEKALYGYASTYRTEGPAVTVSARGTIGYHTVRYGKFTPIVRLITLKPSIENLDIKFLDYCLGVIDISHSGGSIPQLTVPNLKKMEIPVPPLEIQESIVEILDKFTNLEANLEAELEARTLQYEYYRSSLFNTLKNPETGVPTIAGLVKELCPEGVEYRPLGEIADIGTGKSDKKDAQESGQYPFYVRSKTILRSSKYLYDETAIVIPGEGGVGEIFHFVSGKYDLHQRAYRVSFTVDEMNPKFGYYYISSFFKEYINRHAVEATVKSIRKPMLVKFEVPVPPMEIQQRIVDILDRFDALTSSLSEGLPAELAARRSQYEYYRDQLLSFPRKGDNQ